MMSSLQRSHHISAVSLPFSQLAAPYLLNSSLSTVLQSHPVELSWTGLSDTLLLYCGTLCHLNFAVLKTVARQGQISYPNLHFCQNSRLISFASQSYPDSSKSASVITSPRSKPSYLASPWPPDYHCIDYHYQSLSPTTTWTPLAISLDLCSYYTTWRWDIFMFGVYWNAWFCTRQSTRKPTNWWDCAKRDDTTSERL